ncbi:YceI family protein [Spiribacter vilamensis]|uniref:Polyisoprenoid-binding protein YceI n=1 Tax=Spiribacter vilamensis TaxID=531306 RepID=A0A4V2GIW8_9GAMM|nr:YceI family protein [Spiribacter vilamensis]RZU98075.1 polyisoprenoid-binding protein YceI [Spiribacter vilamensis]TVO61023.1 YceI family protein [Spiribacter vilamensis]
MARFRQQLILPVLGLAAATAVQAEPERFQIDESHVSVGFLVGHARFADVLGQFTDVSGGFVYDADTQTLTSGRVEVVAETVFTGHDERDDHVRDGDFLDVDAHPVIVFEASGYQPVDDRRGVLKGDLTLLGETRPIELDLTLNRRGDHPIGGADTLGGSARGTIQRSDFGMDYALQGDLVSDAIELIVEFEAVRQDD